MKRAVQRILQVIDFDIRIRYQPVKTYLKQADPLNKDSVLEVGSGSLGLTRYLKRKITGFDQEFLGDLSSFLQTQKGDATHLPFPNQSFDHVISVDLLEHLPPPKRPLAIWEMLRMARKGVVLVFPCSKESEEAEQCLVAWYKKRHEELPQWLTEHLSNGLPASDEILEIVSSFERTQEQKIKIVTFPNQNLKLWFFCSWLFAFGTIPFFFMMVLFWIITPLVFFFARIGHPYRRVFILFKSQKLVYNDTYVITQSRTG